VYPLEALGPLLLLDLLPPQCLLALLPLLPHQQLVVQNSVSLVVILFQLQLVFVLDVVLLWVSKYNDNSTVITDSVTVTCIHKRLQHANRSHLITCFLRFVMFIAHRCCVVGGGTPAASPARSGSFSSSTPTSSPARPAPSSGGASVVGMFTSHHNNVTPSSSLLWYYIMHVFNERVSAVLDFTCYYVVFVGVEVCKACGQGIAGSAVKALNAIWHKECFTCTSVRVATRPLEYCSYGVLIFYYQFSFIITVPNITAIWQLCGR
jgi:hypothetical protein